MANILACRDMCCKLQSCSNHKQHEDEDDIVELGESDNDIIIIIINLYFRLAVHTQHKLTNM